MMEQKPERVIYFKDLLFAILYQWKWMVAAAVICGLLLGATQFIGGSDIANMDGTPITSETQIKIEHHRQILEQSEVGITAQTDYMENSILMSLDPYAAYTAGFHLYAHPQSLQGVADRTGLYDSTGRILRSYAVFISREDTIQTLSEEFGIESKYMAELIRSSISGTEFLTITVRGVNHEEAAKLAAAVRRLIEAEKAAVDKSIEPHSLNMVDFNAGPRVDSELQSTQTDAQQKLTNMKNARITSTTELEKLLPLELSIGDSGPVLLVAVGAIAGICLVALVAVVAHMASSRVYSAKALKQYTGLNILGRVCGSKKRGAVIRRLRRLEGRSEYGQLDVAAMNLRNHCKDIGKLLIMGHYEEEELKPLMKVLSEKGTECILCGDPEISAKALELLPDCDGVVLVETCGRSRYDSILWAQEATQAQNKALIGCVLIDG